MNGYQITHFIGTETQAALRAHFRSEMQDEFERSDERIEAWHRIVKHPFFKECIESDGTLIDTMLAKLDTAESPEPKPWHAAKQGEVWLVTHASWASPKRTVRLVNANRCFVDVHSNWPALDMTNTTITAAERIYPREGE